ncbi:O-antigen ligase family protein [Wenzhouxiangella marina]|uniref:Uncharacterized protein n=1 Tax=Wenzhouxiangella marina TaxID=1579979 RepID=A0A0K0XTJ0_9GAMM|nr:O-antigen ligase family protein [Wenzhouxiangella marina]AKS41029.1 hypothetical protein WM2015_648 [Wenzhouxiangella marina]MBB6087907.1 (heptosyl)LPS beta-1,4-glucosyltransferase [Wenzhouxiangella marina]
MNLTEARSGSPPAWLQAGAAVVVFLALALGLVVPKLAGAGFLLLGLTAIVWLSIAKQWRPGDLVPIERLLCMAIVLFVVAWLLGWGINGLDPAGLEAVTRIARLLLIIPILLFIRQLDTIESAWWRGLTLGAIIAGAYAWWSFLSGQVGPFGERVVGTTNPLYFGGLSLAFALMLLPRLRDVSLPVSVRLLAVLALLLAISASALSGSRGAWVVLPLLLLIYLFTLGRSQPPVWRFGVPLAFMAIATAFLFSPASPMSERAMSGLDDLSALVRGEQAEGTIGRRMALWELAGEVIAEHPLSGSGPGAYPRRVTEAIAEGRIPEDFEDYEHPHNEYLSAWIQAGPLGLFALVLMFGIALRRHGRVWQTGLKRTRYLGWSGLAGLSTIAIMALSESLFERNIGIVWYGLIVALSAGLVHARRRVELSAPDSRRRHTISVIVICKDQAGEIDRCLGSVAGWADEIIVLDSGSSDDTVERCRRYTDQVHETDWPGFGLQKQRALDLARCDWVLSMDADEALSETLRREIDRVLAEDAPDHEGYRLCWVTHAFGQRLSFGHWARAPLRLFRRELGHFTPVAVHEKVVLEPGARIGFLEAPLDHYVYRDLAHARQKLSRYASLQARERYERGKRVRLAMTPLLRAGFNLLDNLILRTAFLDGRGGWTMSWLYTRYTYEKYRQLLELSRG